MTIKEWSDTLVKELKEAGYEILRMEGPLPLVKSPEEFEDKIKFLKFTSPSNLPICFNIFEDGCLITPGLK